MRPSKVKQKPFLPSKLAAGPPDLKPEAMMMQFMVVQMELLNKQTELRWEEQAEQNELRREEQAKREELRREEDKRRWDREDHLRMEAERMRQAERLAEAEERRAAEGRAELRAAEKKAKEEDLAEQRREEAERRLAETAQRKKERLLRSIAKITRDEDLEVYLDGLEHHLQQCQVEEEEWQLYLTANMTGKFAELVQGLTIDPDEPYAKLRGRLLEAAGLTARDAGLTLLQLEMKDLRGKTALETFQRVTRLVKRLFKGSDTVNDYFVALTLPVMRKILPKDGVTFFENRNPNSMEEILETLQHWWSISGSVKEDHTGGLRARPQLTCFNCGKPGHRASECWSKQGSAGVSTKPGTNTARSSWTCFTCGQKGHKLPQCPQKGKVAGPSTTPGVRKEKATVRSVHRGGQSGRRLTSYLERWVAEQQLLC